MRPLTHPLRPPRRSSLANLHALFFQLDLLLNITGHSLRATPSHDLFQLRGAISSLWPAGMIAWGVSWVAPGQGYAKLLAGHCKASCPGAPLHAPGKQLPQAASPQPPRNPALRGVLDANARFVCILRLSCAYPTHSRDRGREQPSHHLFSQLE